MIMLIQDMLLVMMMDSGLIFLQIVDKAGISFFMPLEIAWQLCHLKATGGNHLIVQIGL